MKLDDPSNGQEPYALRQARKNHPVKLYAAPGCGRACDAARELLIARGVPFAEISVSNESAIAELKQVSGAAAVPVLLVGNIMQKGFEESAFHRHLDAAGYPKTGILRPRPPADPKTAKSPEGEASAETASARGPYAPRLR